MNKTVAGIILAVVSVALIGGVVAMNGNDSDTASTDNMSSMPMESAQGDDMAAMPAKDNEVQIKGYAFGPKELTVKVGTKVTWTNQDKAKHDITPDNPSADFVASELLAMGESYSFTFMKAGTYSYICSPHPYMKATVTVVE